MSATEIRPGPPKSNTSRSCAVTAFVVSLILIMISYAYAGIAPFGDRSVAISDGAAQYISFMAYMRDLFVGKQDAFYAFEKTLGGNITGLMAYYTLSPVNFVLLFFSPDRLPLAEGVVVAIKLSLCGAAMAVFLSEAFDNSRVYTILFSVAYAFCGYCVSFYWCMMWLDGVIMLPLAALGIRRLFQGKSALPYMLSLGFAIAVNFYTGYMLCVFSVIYFAYLLYADGKPLKQHGREILKFCMGSLGAGAVSAPVLLPALLSMRGGKKVSFMPLLNWYTYSTSLNVLDRLCPDKAAQHNAMVKYVLAVFCVILLVLFLFLLLVFVSRKSSEKAKRLAVVFVSVLLILFSRLFEHSTGFAQKFLLGFVNDYERVEGRAAVYAGILPFVFMLGFFLSSEIRQREKTGALCVMALLLLSMELYVPNLIWHGFTENNCFNYRYSFVLSFFILELAARMPGKLRSLRAKDWLLIVLICSAALVSSLFPKKINIPDSHYLFAFFAVLIFCAVFYYIDMAEPSRWRKAAAWIIVPVHLFSLCAPFALTLENHTADSPEINVISCEEYRAEYAAIKGTVSAMEEADGGLYRAHIGDAINDPMEFGYNGVSHFSSTEPSKLVNFLGMLGLSSYQSVWASDAGGTRALDSFFGVKYSADDPFSDYRRAENGLLYENPYALPVAFMAFEDKTSCEFDEYSPFENLNALYHSLGEDDVYRPVNAELTVEQLSPEKVRVSMTFTPDSDDPVFFYLKNGNGSGAELYVDGEFIAELSAIKDCHTYCLGSRNGRQTVVSMVSGADQLDFLRENMLLCYESGAVLSNCHDAVSGNVEIHSPTDSKIAVKASAADDDRILLFTIPYDTGWKITVDGEKAGPLEAFGTLLAVKIGAGEHSVEMKYTPPGLYAGVILCLAALALALPMGLKKRKDPSGT